MKSFNFRYFVKLEMLQWISLLLDEIVYFTDRSEKLLTSAYISGSTRGMVTEIAAIIGPENKT